MASNTTYKVKPKNRKTTARDLTGQRFGKLVAISPTDERQDAKIVWLFKCDCGKEIKLVGKSATTGNTTSCGCFQVSQMRKLFDTMRVEKICKTCNKHFKIKQSHAKKEGTYCSRACMAIGYKSTMDYKNNPNFRHGMALERGFYAETYKRWREINWEKVSNYNKKCRAKRNQAEGIYEIKDVKSKIKLQKGKCFWCLSLLNDHFHADHVIPLSRGGSNWPDNIVIACPTCNLQKRNFMPEEWFKRSNCRAKQYDYPGKISV